MPNTNPDIFGEQASPLKERRIYTVSEITQDIKIILENTFTGIWVEGEVSNFRASQAGHFYLSLKDGQSLLMAAVFNHQNKKIKFKIEDGLKVICFGSIDVYPPRGQYQLIIEEIEPKGIGGLQLALEQLKKKLEKEGLFAPSHKRPVPYLPSKIGVVTSLQAAAIKDILKVLDRRFRDIHIIVSPCQVQGESAKNEIASAIKNLNSLNEKLPANEKIEVMIVGRGGGSTEDLWAFNEEVVARAIYNSQIPVISAVGHERDITVSDLVADLRAATPSVAAELVIPKREDLKEQLNSLIAGAKNAYANMLKESEDTIETLRHRLNLSMENSLKLSRSECQTLQKKLLLLNPVSLIQEYSAKAKDLGRQIYVRMQHFLEIKEAAFQKGVEKLSNLSPLNILSRGYSITFKMPQEVIIKDASGLKIGDIIKNKLHKGEILSRVTEV
ncbi:MAG: exodeoxyribonuclease VII large subunit [Candidatus Omnitrophota bacterium]